MKIYVRLAGDRAECLAAIDRSEQRGGDREDMVFISGIDTNASVVKTARDDARFFRNHLPVLAAIIRAIEGTFLCFQNGVNDIGITWRDTDADAADLFRQSIGKPGPGASRIN